MSQDTLADRMRKLEISESDLRESFARSSGPGGQNVNKVATAVTLRHCPTGISVTVQDSRSQAVNRRLARGRKSPRPVALKEKILETKRKRGELKKQRGKIQLD